MPLRKGTTRASPTAAAGSPSTAPASMVALTATSQRSTGVSRRATAFTGTLKSPNRALRTSIPAGCSTRSIPVDAGALNRELVLANDVIVGSVNANKRHYQQAAEALDNAGRDWLARMVTRRVPLDRFQEAFQRRPNDVKVAIEFAAATRPVAG
jgi:threonine dehydrogenase-like Zn-dependent dehydrogenase